MITCKTISKILKTTTTPEHKRILALLMSHFGKKPLTKQNIAIFYRLLMEYRTLQPDQDLFQSNSASVLTFSMLTFRKC